MNRELVSREALGVTVKADAVPVEGDPDDVPIRITACRRGDTFVLGGRISKITGDGITVSVAGTLTVGEAVCLQHAIGSMGQTERYERVLQQLGETCDFEFLSLNNRQLQRLTETRDWILLDLA